MKNSISQEKRSINCSIIFITLFGLLGSIGFGIIFSPFPIYDPSKHSFQFITCGLMAPAFFSFYKFRTIRAQLLLFAAFVLIHTVSYGKPFQVSWLIRDIFFISSVAISVKLYFLFLKKYSKLPFFIRSFALVFFYSLLNIIAGLLVYLINAKAGFLPIDGFFFFARYGVLIGLGVGLGIDLYFMFEQNLFKLFKIKFE